MNHPNIRVLKATTTRDFEEQVNQLFPHCDVYISSAALSDIEFPENPGKLKKKEPWRYNRNKKISRRSKKCTKN